MPSSSRLTAQQILYLHFEIIERTTGAHGLLSLDALEAAVARPFAGIGDQELYPDLFAKAAALMVSLIKNHPFVDGNKRTGIVAAGIFLERNGWWLDTSQDELVSFTLRVATVDVSIEEVTAWLRQFSRPLR